MFVILVYDAAPKRGVKLLKFLRKYLFWVQNSVFEGEITKAKFAEVKAGIRKIINKEEDSVIYYTFTSGKNYSREVIGVERNDTDSFI